jgi:hypothetical protein
VTKSLLCFSAASAPRAKIDVDKVDIEISETGRELILPSKITF